LHIIANINPKTNGVDEGLYKEDKDKIFTVKSAYNVFKRDSVSENNGVFTYLWSLKESIESIGL